MLQVDAVFDVTSIAVAALIVLGLTFPASQPGAGGPPAARSVRSLAVVGLALAVPAFPSAVGAEQAAFEVTQGTTAYAMEDTSTALRDASLALGASKGFAPASHLELLAMDATGDLDDAVATARRLVAVEDLPQHRLRLAILLERAGGLGEAQTIIDDVARRDPSDPLIMVNAAAFAARHGHADRVRRSLTDAYIADGRLARLDLPPALELERDAAVSDAAAAIMANPGPTAVDRAASLLVWAGDPDAATELLTKDAPNGDQIMAMAVRAAKREPGASDRLRELVMSSPDERAVRWAWLAAIESCDAPAWLRWSRSYVIITGVNLRAQAR